MFYIQCEISFFPAGPAEVLPCPTGAHISKQILERGLLIALVMEAADL
jgi:hypothetical protein